MSAPALTANSQFVIRNSQLPDWFTPPRFAIFLLLAFVVAFPGIWLGTETFFRSDYGVMAYPSAHYLRESLRAGELPLWNPLSNCGAPFLAQWGTMCLYPGSLFFVALPMPWALGVFCLLHLWLGGLGARALAERWTGNPFAAAVAGTAFAINGASLACITWPNYCVALGWMPWIILLTEQSWRTGGRKLVLAALASTMQMLTGVPELVILTWGLLAVMLLGEVFEEGKRQKAKGKSAEALADRSTLSFFLFPFSFAAVPLRFGAITALVAALSAAQLLPFFDLLAHSQRDAAYRDARWPMPPWGWANFLVPLFRYFQTPQGFWVQQDQQFLSSYYLGLGVVALALVAVWKARERRIWLLAGATAFALIMALGDAGFLYSALKNLLPGGGIARFPVKFVLLAAFTVPMLAAFGVAWLMSRSRRGEEADSGIPDSELPNAECRMPSPPPDLGGYEAGRSSALLALGLALVAGVAAILWLGQQHPLQYDRWSETKANALVRVVLLAGSLGALAVGCGLGACPLRERGLAGLGALLLLALDVCTHHPHQSPRIESSLFSPTYPGKFRMHPNFGPARLMISPADEETLLYGRHVNPHTLPPGLPAEPAYLWTLDYIGKRRAGWSHLNLLDGALKVNGSSTLQIREQASLQRALYPTNPTAAPVAQGLKDFFGVRPLRYDQAHGFLHAGSSGTNWAAAQSLVAAGQKIHFATPEETLRHLPSEDYNPRQVVFLPLEAKDVAVARGTTNVGLSVTHKRFTAHEILADVETDAPTLVTIAQSFYHPWRAFVDGQPVKLWRANYAFQALAVPAGKHTVRLVYVDEKFRLGLGISLAGLAVCGFLWWRSPRSEVQSPKSS